VGVNRKGNKGKEDKNCNWGKVSLNTKERERELDRQIDRKIERERETERVRQTDRQKNRERERESDRRLIDGDWEREGGWDGGKLRKGRKEREREKENQKYEARGKRGKIVVQKEMRWDKKANLRKRNGNKQEKICIMGISENWKDKEKI